MSKLVGLTGGIGSGKTTVGKMFAALGIPVYNSDIEAKKLMETSGKLKKALKDLLGEESYIGERLNKTYISEQIFKSKSLLDTMNSIVHPEVRNHFLVWAENQTTRYVIQEAAIIFESGSQDFYDKTILVIAPQHTRVERIMERSKKVAIEDVEARMNNQWKDSKKIQLSDYIIENIHLKTTENMVSKVHQNLLKHFESNAF